MWRPPAASVSALLRWLPCLQALPCDTSLSLPPRRAPALSCAFQVSSSIRIVLGHAQAHVEVTLDCATISKLQVRVWEDRGRGGAQGGVGGCCDHA